FFSSRRRHTRFSRDWSSDVCSSDLRPLHKLVQETDTVGIDTDMPPPAALWQLTARFAGELIPMPGNGSTTEIQRLAVLVEHNLRSEERRVGKEGRSRCWEHERQEHR